MVTPECIVRDGTRFNGGERLFISAKSGIEIKNNTSYTVVCEYNDFTNKLSIKVNGTITGPVELNPTRFPGATFGDVDVTGTNECSGGGSSSLGNVITLGNKPCGGLDPDDRFVGTIFRAAVQQR